MQRWFYLIWTYHVGWDWSKYEGIIGRQLLKKNLALVDVSSNTLVLRIPAKNSILTVPRQNLGIVCVAQVTVLQLYTDSIGWSELENTTYTEDILFEPFTKNDVDLDERECM